VTCQKGSISTDPPVRIIPIQIYPRLFFLENYGINALFQQLCTYCSKKLYNSLIVVTMLRFHRCSSVVITAVMGSNLLSNYTLSDSYDRQIPVRSNSNGSSKRGTCMFITYMHIYMSISIYMIMIYTYICTCIYTRCCLYMYIFI
jgi:hypothetical protein